MNKRILIVLAVALICSVTMVGVYFKVPFLPSCLLYEHTGVHCPGCGITRASRSMMQGELALALRYNPLVVILSPLLIAWFVIEITYWIQKRNYEFARLKPLYIKVIFTVVVVWFITRNIPHKAFEWARPTPDTIFDQE